MNYGRLEAPVRVELTYPGSEPGALPLSYGAMKPLAQGLATSPETSLRCRCGRTVAYPGNATPAPLVFSATATLRESASTFRYQRRSLSWRRGQDSNLQTLLRLPLSGRVESPISKPLRGRAGWNQTTITRISDERSFVELQPNGGKWRNRTPEALRPYCFRDSSLDQPDTSLGSPG